MRINRAQEPRSSLQALLRLLLNLALSGSITYLGGKLKIGGEKGRIAEVGLTALRAAQRPIMLNVVRGEYLLAIAIRR